MDEDIDAELDRDIEPGLSEQYRKASPWPLFVALGFVLSEVGVVLGYFSVTVVGIIVFGGTVGAILQESGYIAQSWRAMVAIGALFALLGAVVVAAWGETLAVAGLLDPANGVAYRGFAVAIAGAILAAVGTTVRVAGRQPV
jgi:Sec-independent protein secretion pathway component TatC